MPCAKFPDEFYICRPNARVAQLVEHDLAKVGVAGSSPVSRSRCLPTREASFFYVGRITFAINARVVKW